MHLHAVLATSILYWLPPYCTGYLHSALATFILPPYCVLAISILHWLPPYCTGYLHAAQSGDWTNMEIAAAWQKLLSFITGQTYHHFQSFCLCLCFLLCLSRLPCFFGSCWWGAFGIVGYKLRVPWLEMYTWYGWDGPFSEDKVTIICCVRAFWCSFLFLDLVPCTEQTTLLGGIMRW